MVPERPNALTGSISRLCADTRKGDSRTEAPMARARAIEAGRGRWADQYGWTATLTTRKRPPARQWAGRHAGQEAELEHVALRLRGPCYSELSGGNCLDHRVRLCPRRRWLRDRLRSRLYGYRSVRMSQQTHSSSPDHMIPVANCIRCKVGMRLAAIEPTRRPGVDRLVFECTCGYSIRLPVRRADADQSS